MRKIFLTSLLVGVAACDAGEGTGPGSAAIAVRVTDDRGAPVSRALVTVTWATATRVEAETRGDGTADIALADAGVYRASILPGARYVATDALSKSVTVAPNTKATVDFTLYRVGISEPRPDLPGG